MKVTYKDAIPATKEMRPYIEQVREHAMKIPYWRRWLLCRVFYRREWTAAKAHYKVAVWHWGCANDLWLICNYYAARCYAEIYGMPEAQVTP